VGALNKLSVGREVPAGGGTRTAEQQLTVAPGNQAAERELEEGLPRSMLER
jgi:hypothetical protein